MKPMNCDSHQHATPLMDAPLGSCGKPCDQTCDEPCADKPAPLAKSRWAHWLNASLFNTLDLCFDEVYEEPKKILIVGGCRQMDWAQHVALLLPAAEIHLVDPDEAMVKRAQEEICCRFKFVTAALGQLPYETDQFDLTLAHNLLALPQADWERTLAELSRVTRSNLMVSVHRPLLWAMANRVSGFANAVKELGIEVPTKIPGANDFISQLCRYAKIKTKLAPFPWTVYMTAVRPKWDEKLTLAS